MEYASLLNHLSQTELIEDPCLWTISEIRIGITSPNKYRFQKSGYDLFIKEVQPHERDILLRLSALGFMHVPNIRDKRLLKESMILITDFSPKGSLRSLVLEQTLIEEMALIQNACSESAEPDATARDASKMWVLGCFVLGLQNLTKLQESVPSPILNEFSQLFGFIFRDREAIAHTFGSMPFARLHHDFYPHNILAGPPQVVSDWGSSYGDGPFLYDIAPYLQFSPGSYESFSQKSMHARQADAVVLENWVRCAVNVKLASFFKSVFERGPDALDKKADWARFLEFHFPLFVCKPRSA